MIPLLATVLLVAVLPAGLASQPDTRRDNAQTAVARILEAALADHSAWERLAYLTDHFPERVSGSDGLEGAIDWALEAMRADGLENARREKVMVPHWVRGHEEASLLEPARRPLHMIGLGGSVGTPPEGITAEVIVLGRFDELEEKADQVKGKIVLFNVPFTGYGPTVAYRTRGAARAARYGAVAHLVRSVTPTSLSTPHTGAMDYEEGVAKIPSAAVTVEDALMMQRMQDRGERIVVRLLMEARTLPDRESANTVAEIVGRERPGQVIVLGGHLDAWDAGTGAMDDGGGCVMTWEAVRLIHRLGLHPRRTLRVVLFTNEENGSQGGKGYYQAHQAQVGNHILAIEADSGVFRPKGVRFSGNAEATSMIERAARYLEPIEAGSVERGGGGADISPLTRAGVPGMSLSFSESNYFDYHHSPADTIDKIDPDDMARCVAVLAVMAYMVADSPEALPATPPGGATTGH